MNKLINSFIFLALLAPVLFSAAGALAVVEGSTTTASKRSVVDILPACAKTGDMSKESPCRDVSIFVVVLINVARYLFSIIGALALLMFVYGGFMLIISSGSAERVKKGGQIMLAAMVGLLISFTAYMVVRFLGGAVGLETGFKLK